MLVFTDWLGVVCINEAALVLAVNSILRDWIKGQVTAVECGILSFEAVFLPYMLTHDGRPLIERVSELLPEATEPKVVQIPHRP